MDARYAGAGSPRLVERTQVTRRSRPSLVRRVAHVPSTFAAALVLAALLVCLPLALAARAEGFVYWTKLEGPFSNGLPIKPLAGIGRANLDGSGVDQSFITGVDGLRAWQSTAATSTGRTFPLTAATIGRANLDGTGVDPSFIGGLNLPAGVAVDGGHVYWTSGALDGTIGRANLDGTEVDPNFISGASTRWGRGRRRPRLLGERRHRRHDRPRQPRRLRASTRASSPRPGASADRGSPSTAPTSTGRPATRRGSVAPTSTAPRWTRASSPVPACPPGWRSTAATSTGRTTTATA